MPGDDPSHTFDPSTAAPAPARTIEVPSLKEPHTFDPSTAAPAPSRATPPPSPVPAPSSRTRSRYALQEELARGGLGMVQRAWDHALDRGVAIKRLLRPSPRSTARFDRETRITARLQHPNIVPVHDGGRLEDGLPFMAMRLVQGRSLADAIAERRTLDERMRLLPHVIDACNAVAYAHSERIAHRDLKPDNILVGDFGETVVIDWGLAKELDVAGDEGRLADSLAAGRSDGSSGSDASSGGRAAGRSPSGRQLTRVGAVMGTPAYMPPEQAAGRPVDERADVYALGAVLYHTLSGHRPYAESEDTLLAVSVGPPRPLGELVADVPRDLLAVTAKAMERDPAARYPDARALAAELERFQAGAFVSAHRYTALERLRRAVRRNPVAAGLAALSLVGAAIGVSLLWRAERTTRALRELDRQRADAITMEQARSLLAVDGGRTLALLNSLSADHPFDGEVRTLATAAWAADPPAHLRLPAESGPLSQIEWTDDGLLACATDLLSVFGHDLSLLRTTPLAMKPYGCVAFDGGMLASGWTDVALAEGDGPVTVREGAVEVSRVATGPGVPYAYTLRGADLVYRTQTGEHRFPLLEDAYDLDVTADGKLVALLTSSVVIVDSVRHEEIGRVEVSSDAWVVEASRTDPEVAVFDSEGGTTWIRWDDGVHAVRMPSNAGWWEAGLWMKPGVILVGSQDELLELRLGTMETYVHEQISGRPTLMLQSPKRSPDGSPAGGDIAVATDEGALAWLTWPGHLVVELGESPDPFVDLAWSPDGAMLAAASARDLAVHRRNDRAAWFKGETSVQYLLPLPDGSLLAVGHAVDRLEPGHEPQRMTSAVWGEPTQCGEVTWVVSSFVEPFAIAALDARGKPITTAILPSTSAGIRCVPDGTVVVPRDDGGLSTVALDGTITELVPGSDAAWVQPRAAVSSDGRILFATTRVVEFASSTAAPVELPLPVAVRPRAIAWWHGEPVVVLADGSVRHGRGADARILDGTPAAGAVAIGATPDGLLVVGDADGALWVWATPSSPGVAGTLHPQDIITLAVHPSGRWVATGGWDELVVIWDLSHPSLPGRVLEGHRSPIEALAWSMDGRTLYSADDRGEVRAWTDPLATDARSLRRQVRAMVEALDAGRFVPTAEELRALAR